MFCYRETKEITFSVTRYSNWEKALDKNRRFYKHQFSLSYHLCVSKLQDKQKRIETGTGILPLLNENVPEKC